jgi:2-keto-4-pentenoate hydratase/2-oxohepta-3-ene-1,7-dioic acid hydratase in catechol pathway
MKLVRYSDSSGKPAWGVISGASVYALDGDPLDTSRLGSIAGPTDSLRLLAPCRPGKIIGIAINFPGASGLTENMAEPLVFLKAGTSVCGPGDDIICRFSSPQVWGEAELAVIVGRNNSIFGYTAANDVSANNIENRDHHLARSKSADTFCPLGPWIDTEYSPAHRLIQGFQNEELIRRGNSDERLWHDERLIQWLAIWMTLEPWDVILTGAPTRVVPRRYLKDGDEFVVRIDGLGELRNRFREDRRH